MGLLQIRRYRFKTRKSLETVGVPRSYLEVEYHWSCLWCHEIVRLSSALVSFLWICPSYPLMSEGMRIWTNQSTFTSVGVLNSVGITLEGESFLWNNQSQVTGCLVNGRFVGLSTLLPLYTPLEQIKFSILGFWDWLSVTIKKS